MNRFRTLIACAVVGILAAGGAYVRAQEPQGPPTVSTVGCLGGFPRDLRFEDASGVYRLMGNTEGLTPLIGEEVAITGLAYSMWLATPGRAIQVISAKAVARPPAAALDPVSGDPAHWSSQVDRRWGVSIAFPGTRIADLGPGPRPRLPIQDNVAIVHRSTIPAAIYSHSDFAGGYLAVFADPDVRNAERCAAASPRSPGAPAAPNTLTIAGVDYEVEAAADAPPGSTAKTRYLRTFRDGICYEFAFLFSKSDGEDSGTLGCMVASADPSGLARLIVSEVSFFPPRSRSAR